MKADTLTLKALFQKEVRYVIPTFQRPYVWTQEDQWEGLWDDLRNAAEAYLEDLEQANGNNALAEEQGGSDVLVIAFRIVERSRSDAKRPRRSLSEGWGLTPHPWGNSRTRWVLSSGETAAGNGCRAYWPWAWSRCLKASSGVVSSR